MTIYFLAASLGYSKQKIPPNKVLSPTKFRLRGMPDVFVATYKVQLKLMRQQPEARPLPFLYALMPPHFVFKSVITLIETICLKICPRTTAQECKKSTSGGR